MGELIRFPVERRRVENVVGEPISMDECSGIVHVFNEVPGRCKCGENEWTPDHKLEPSGISVFAPPKSSA